MRQLNLTITPGITDLWVKIYDDAKRDVPVAAVLKDRWVLQFDNGDASSGGLNVRINAPGYREWVGRFTMPPDNVQKEADTPVEMQAGSGPFPQAPTRDKLLTGVLTGQGLYLYLPRFGRFPWWPPCWAWLTQEERASVAAQLLALGEELTCVEVPCGPPLYDEPDQFYSPDKFGPLDWTNGNTRIDPAFPALIEELIRYGFKGVWIFQGGDAGQAGVPMAMAQAALLGPALVSYMPGVDLNDYVVYLPGWDGTWHKPDGSGTGWNPNQFQAWADAVLVASGKYVGMEHALGYEPVGEGGDDFKAGGHLYRFSLILGEFDGGNPYTSDSWQLLGRLSRPYVKMPGQGSDDPNPPYYLGGLNDLGQPYVYRVWEYAMYPHVRFQDPAITGEQRQIFVNTGALYVD